MRLPPYGREVAAGPNNVFIYAGVDAWMAGKARAYHCGPGSVLVLPPGDDYRQYRWPVWGVPLLLDWLDGSLAEVRGFAEYLVRCGSPHVAALYFDDPDGCLHVKPVYVSA